LEKESAVNLTDANGDADSEDGVNGAVEEEISEEEAEA